MNEKVALARHKVLERTILLEGFIDLIIELFFFMPNLENEKNLAIHGKMMGTRVSVFQECFNGQQLPQKIKIIKEIAKSINHPLSKKFNKKVQHYLEIRNKFAHVLCKRFPFDKDYKEYINLGKLKEVFDQSRVTKKWVDYEQTHKRLNDEIYNELEKLLADCSKFFRNL